MPSDRNNPGRRAGRNRRSSLDARIAAESIGFTAIAEVLSIAARSTAEVTSEDAFALGRELAPELFGEDSLLLAAHEPKTVQEFRQRASAESEIHHARVDPLDLLEQEIQKLEALVNTPVATNLLRLRLSDLVAAREWFVRMPATETRILQRDVFGTNRGYVPSGITNGAYRDYRLRNGRRLRLMMLHPDYPEHSTGADLLYEICWPEKSLVRFALLQYKLWDGNAIRFTSDPRIEAQLRKLARCTCGEGYCNPDSRRNFGYRFPNCASFLRPTDKLQDGRTGRISGGLHAPICAVVDALSPTRQGNKALYKKAIASSAVSHRIFEELFTRNMIGSRWITFEEMENFYVEHRLGELRDRYFIHAQEAG